MVAATMDKQVEGALFNVTNNDMVTELQSFPFDLKFHLITLPDTTDAGDTATVDLWKEAGMKRLIGIKGWAHSTNNSVIVTENPTTTVSNGQLTLTVPAGTNNDKRVYLLVGV